MRAKAKTNTGVLRSAQDDNSKRVGRKKKRPKVLLLSGNCSVKGCERRSVIAHLFTPGLWIEGCNKHKLGNFTIELKNIGVYIDADRVRPELPAIAATLGNSAAIGVADGSVDLEEHHPEVPEL